jgi:GH43 family beta-xylosidase
MCACSGEKNTATTADVTTKAPDGTTVITTTPTVTTLYPDDPEKLVIALPGMTKYSVVSTESKGAKLSKLVSDLTRRVDTKYGITVNKLVDTASEPGKYEIIIGDTTREETKKAKELLGDNDYVITVIENKLVIYSKIDEAYSAITDIVIDFVQNDSFAISRDFSRIKKYKALEETDITLESGKTLSLDLALEHKSSVAEFYLTAGSEGADSYTIKLTDDTLSFFREGEKRETLASVGVVATVGKSYPLRLDFDGEYIRVFYVTVPEGYEPWPEFELNIGNVSDLKLSYCETSGHGAVIDNLKLADYVSDITEGTITYQNLVVKGAPDPEVFDHEGVYYLIGTGSKYPVYKSTDLINWTYVGKALPEVSWQGTFGYWWAPDVEYINGKFYMCVSLAANMFGFAVSDKPEGPYTCVGESFGGEIIDGNLFIDDDGKVYLYFTAWGNRTYGIYVVEMEDDYVTPKWETEKLIMTPTESWEKDQGSVVEGAYMLKHEGKYYLLYSGSNYVGDYALGYAVSDKPNGGFKKAKENPILKGTADVKGVGHVSVVLAPDKETYVMFYHRHVSDTQVDPRDVCIDPMRFVKNEDGSYRIEVYGPTTSKRPAIWLN